MALSFFVAGNTYAGIDKGNGGDATAQSFVDIMNKVYLFLEENPKVLVKASRIEVKKAVKTLQESLGNTAKPSLVEVTLRRPRDKFDVEKAIITTVSPLKVLLHKDSWEQPTTLDINQVKKDQVTLAAMEILLLSGIYEDRYQLPESVQMTPFTPVSGFSSYSTGLCLNIQIASNIMARFEGRSFFSQQEVYERDSRPVKNSNLLISNLTIWF